MNAVANLLNDYCFCVPVDRAKLNELLTEQANDPAFASALATGHEHLFSSAAMFVSRTDIKSMLATVATIEAIARSPLYQKTVMANAPEIAKTDFGPVGVLMGYDFHLTDDGPKLIEINTNAGGVCLNDAARIVRSNCCSGSSGIYAYKPENAANFADQFIAMFQREWQLQRGEATKMKSIAIVDADPEHQYLFPEFLLVKAILETSGLSVFICDPKDLTYNGQHLNLGDVQIDLVYNRHTDFYLKASEMTALMAAYSDGSVVVTPNPHHHALYANKANLVLLSDPVFQAQLNLSDDDRRALNAVPKSYHITPDKQNWFWKNRKTLFFKPQSGHAGKSVYRGDKLTRATFERILQGDFIAQELIVPSIRKIEVDGVVEDKKADIRLYTYNGELLLPAARLYQGQTTNFRTPGGGFAPVLITD